MQKVTWIVVSLLILTGCGGTPEMPTLSVTATPNSEGTSGDPTDDENVQADQVLDDLCEQFCDVLPVPVTVECPAPWSDLVACADYLNALMPNLYSIREAVMGLPARWDVDLIRNEIDDAEAAYAGFLADGCAEIENSVSDSRGAGCHTHVYNLLGSAGTVTGTLDYPR